MTLDGLSVEAVPDHLPDGQAAKGFDATHGSGWQVWLARHHPEGPSPFAHKAGELHAVRVLRVDKANRDGVRHTACRSGKRTEEARLVGCVNHLVSRLIAHAAHLSNFMARKYRDQETRRANYRDATDSPGTNPLMTSSPNFSAPRLAVPTFSQEETVTRKTRECSVPG